MKNKYEFLVFLTGWLTSLSAMAITMPAPPPELSDTLTKFRTQEQMNEGRTINNESGDLSEETGVDSSIFVPGDITSGIYRNSQVYSPELTLGVPVYGASIIRFYDLSGIPWEISSVRCENQGFMAEVTASPSELLVKQGVGASSTKLVVNLINHNQPLVFSLSSVKLEQESINVNTIINSIKVRSYTNSQGYVFPEIKKFPKTNPAAKPVKYEKTSLTQVENTLIDAVRNLKLDEN